MSKNKITIYIIISVVVILVGIIILIQKNNNRPADKTNSIRSTSQENNFSLSNIIGKPAPDFSLKSIDGSTVKLSDYRGKTVVLFINEGGMCYPACWNQIQELARDDRFNSADVVAFSLVTDSKNTWDKITTQTTGFENAKILLDTTKAVSREYGALTAPSSMHPGQKPGHTYFIIDTKGIVRYTYDDPNMAIRNDTIFKELLKIENK